MDKAIMWNKIKCFFGFHEAQGYIYSDRIMMRCNRKGCNYIDYKAIDIPDKELELDSNFRIVKKVAIEHRKSSCQIIDRISFKDAFSYPDAGETKIIYK